jgi:hypothetical protein
MTYGEMFLFFWASVVTMLFFMKKHDMEMFRQFTVMKLKQVAKGDATVVDKGDRVEIISKEIV